MKVLRPLFWSVLALLFGVLAGFIIGGITFVGGLLILRDLILRRPVPATDPD